MVIATAPRSSTSRSGSAPIAPTAPGIRCSTSATSSMSAAMMFAPFTTATATGTHGPGRARAAASIVASSDDRIRLFSPAPGASWKKSSVRQDTAAATSSGRCARPPGRRPE